MASRELISTKSGADPKACIVYDPITYPALKVILFYDSTIPLADQDGFCTCSKHCSTKQNAKYRKCVKVTVALFESGCIITGSIMPEDAQVVRQYIIDKLKAEGEKRTSPRKIQSHHGSHRPALQGIAVCSLKRCVPMYCKAQPSPS
jgi:hypothetical protein